MGVLGGGGGGDIDDPLAWPIANNDDRKSVSDGATVRFPIAGGALIGASK